MSEYMRIFLNEIYNLKKQKRNGWMAKGRELERIIVESVADHSWSATMIAEFFLPSTAAEMAKILGKSIESSQYSKSHIIRLLIIHDLAESYTGDIPKKEKNLTDELTEKKRFEYYRDSLKFTDFGDTFELYNNWEEFYRCETFNAKIAKDIDHLECYIQLFMYKEELLNNNSNSWEQIKKEWTDNLNIYTDFGHWLKIQIDEIFD